MNSDLINLSFDLLLCLDLVNRLLYFLQFHSVCAISRQSENYTLCSPEEPKLFSLFSILVYHPESRKWLQILYKRNHLTIHVNRQQLLSFASVFSIQSNPFLSRPHRHSLFCLLPKEFVLSIPTVVPSFSLSLLFPPDSVVFISSFSTSLFIPFFLLQTSAPLFLKSSHASPFSPQFLSSYLFILVYECTVLHSPFLLLQSCFFFLPFHFPGISLVLSLRSYYCPGFPIF